MLLTTEQIRAWDSYTIDNEPISSYDLMERASSVFTEWFISLYDTSKPIILLCGTGNNGGDGLVIARFLHLLQYQVSVFICHITKNESVDFTKNLEKLNELNVPILRGEIFEHQSFPIITYDVIIIDAILGSGLTRPVSSYWTSFFEMLNQSEAEIVSVDIPSGLFADKHTVGGIIKAKQVLSFELPKLAFLLPENEPYVPQFAYRSIGLHCNFVKQVSIQNYFITKTFIQPFIKKRKKFAHKGVFGHALLVVGSVGMAGAALLAARACMRVGVGLLTIQTPLSNRVILQLGIPEAMLFGDDQENELTKVIDSQKFTTIGIGCGITKSTKMAEILRGYLEQSEHPLVLDADALNILSENPEWLDLIPESSILTPHPKEFERLFGKTVNDFERLELLRTKSKELKINILLKGAHTIVADTEGVCYFNSTGNAGMATAGSGDVLTGIITGLLAQGYEPKMVAIIGVYIHGLAGDYAAQTKGQEAMLASDIVENLSQAFLNMRYEI
ncbi:MAG: NAD(P)H-hydrate dehydratase [Saprospiraceae bacterium]|nr:NAD(P)H-hydrate dehydratase [Saprospiraceae bacterium]